MGIGSKVANKAREALAKIISRDDIPLGAPKKADVNAPVNLNVQTVDQPYRMMFPGVYGNPKKIAQEAESRIGPEDPIMKQLWGVDRQDVSDIARGRVGNLDQPGLILPKNPKGSEAARRVMTPANADRLQSILGEAQNLPGLNRTGQWYFFDPVYQRMEKMMGPDRALEEYQKLNTMMGMASPASDVMTEIQRGSGANWLHSQGRFDDFKNFGGIPAKDRGPNFPADMEYLTPHPYHSTSHAGPMERYLERGSLESKNPKVPLYVGSSGTPQTGFQTSSPVGDAHWSRGVGLADTRKGPTDVGASFSMQEHQTLKPWWEKEVTGPVGLQPGEGQAMVWNALGPQTGVDTVLGAGKLELFSQQIAKAAARLGVTPETARDMILSGRAGAGVFAGVAGSPLLMEALKSRQRDNEAPAAEAPRT